MATFIGRTGGSNRRYPGAIRTDQPDRPAAARYGRSKDCVAVTLAVGRTQLDGFEVGRAAHLA